MNVSSKDAWPPLVAGIAGGTMSTTLLLPLDNIKVRLQVHEGETAYHKSKVPHRMGSVRLVRGILRHEGLSGLYQGLTPAVFGSAITWGGFFFVYEGCKTELRQRRMAATASTSSSLSNPADYTLSSWDNFVLACTSGAIMVALTNPIWLIKTRMQLQMKKASQQLHASVKPYNGMMDAASTIVREEGPLALYKGAGPALLLTSHGGVQFVVYEFLRKHFHYVRAKRSDNTNGGEKDSVLDRLEKSAGYLTIGAIAKVVASTVTYPIQVLKARMQQRSEFVELTSEGDVRVVKRDYSTITGTVQKIWQKEGVSGFYKGCIPNAVRVAPSSAVTFVVYEATLDFLSSSN